MLLHLISCLFGLLHVLLPFHFVVEAFLHLIKNLLVVAEVSKVHMLQHLFVDEIPDLSIRLLLGILKRVVQILQESERTRIE